MTVMTATTLATAIYRLSWSSSYPTATTTVLTHQNLAALQIRKPRE